MPGIYLHIPFCKQACHYCNFHFSTTRKLQAELVTAILREMELRADYLPAGTVTSIYFGGGTPSLLSTGELAAIFDRLYTLFSIADDAEITLEANPDDLTQEKLKELQRFPVNRLSIGIQSFHEEDLRFFNRAHNAIEARACIEYAQDLGFENLNIDLIYGAPTTTDAHWEHNLQIFFDYEIPHLSAYALTVEEKTALASFIAKGKVVPPSEEQTALQFEFLMRAMRAEGYEHYEISNFALTGLYARHNSSYWTGEPYVGFGPSAHSFDGQSRQWNIAHNALYIKLLENMPEVGPDGGLFEREVLTPGQRYNEYVMTSIRTSWGSQLKKIAEDFRSHFLEKMQPFVREDLISRKGEVFTLTDRGKLLADHIAMELFWEE